ncbi:MAG: ATP-binding cassette domain-containing protein [Myxococcota bacterium]
MAEEREDRVIYPVEVKGLVAGYGEKIILEGVDFIAYPGEITVILGGSGCGKSTLLRNILGLFPPIGGTVKLFGEEIGRLSDKELKRLRSNIGVLFQNGALFTSMSVGENVAMVIREHTRLPDDIVNQMVRMKLAQVGLEDAITKYPNELSGGMKKRAALARAIALDPLVLFCDEPSAGLDPVVASELDDLLINLRNLFKMSVIVVTHELESIKKIADRVVMLDKGKVIAEGRLEEVMKSKNPKVFDFFHRISHTEEKASSSLLSLIEGDGK